MLTMVFEVLHEGESLHDDNGEVLTVSDATPATIQELFRCWRVLPEFEHYDDWMEFAIDLSFNPIFVDLDPLTPEEEEELDRIDGNLLAIATKSALSDL